MLTKLLFAGLIACFATQPLLATDKGCTNDFPPPGGDVPWMGGPSDSDYYNGQGNDATYYVTVASTPSGSSNSSSGPFWTSSPLAPSTQGYTNSGGYAPIGGGYIGGGSYDSSGSNSGVGSAPVQPDTGNYTPTGGWSPIGGWYPIGADTQSIVSFTGDYNPAIYEAAPPIMRVWSRLKATLDSRPAIFGTSATIEVNYRFDEQFRQILSIDQPTVVLDAVTGLQFGWRHWYSNGPATITNYGTTATIMIRGTLVNGGFRFGDPPEVVPMRIEVTLYTDGSPYTTVTVWK
jgi:hypothetical protein